MLYLCFLMEPLILLYKAFLWLFLAYASPRWFPFVSVTNITKLECLHQAASCAIIGCLSSSPIPLFFSETSLPPLQVTLTHFTLSCYERTLCLPISFSILGLARLGVIHSFIHACSVCMSFVRLGHHNGWTAWPQHLSAT